MEKCSDTRRHFYDKKCSILPSIVIFVFFIVLIVCVCVLFVFHMKLLSDIHDLKISKEYEKSANHMKEHAQVRDEVQILKMNLSKVEKEHISDLLQLEKQLLKTLSHMNDTFQERNRDLKREVESTKTELSNKIIKLQGQHSSDISKIVNNHTGDISQLEGKIRSMAGKVEDLEGHKDSQQAEIFNFRGRMKNLEDDVGNIWHNLNSRNSAGKIHGKKNVLNWLPLVVLVLCYFIC